MKLPEEVKPIWSTTVLFQISRGIDTGLRLFIIGPFLYEIFQKIVGDENALFYASLVWAIYCGLIAIIELPTGALADVFGRVRMLIASMVLNMVFGIGVTCLIFFKSLPVVLTISLMAFTLRAAAYTFYNGAYSAWVADSIREVAPNFGYDQILAKGNAYYSWAKIIGGILGVAMYLNHIPYLAFLTGSMVCLCCIVYCVAEMHEPKTMHFASIRTAYKKSIRLVRETISTGFKVCHRYPVVFWLVITFATYDFLLSVVQYLWPVAMKGQYGSAKWSPKWYGMVIGISIIGGVGAHTLAWLSGRSHQKNGRGLTNGTLRKIFIWSCAIASLPVIGLGLLNHMGIHRFVFFSLTIFLIEFAYGVIEPAYSTLIQNYIPVQHSKERATIGSIGSMLSNVLLFTLLVPLSGDSIANSTVGWVLPASMLLIAIPVCNFQTRKTERGII